MVEVYFNNSIGRIDQQMPELVWELSWPAFLVVLAWTIIVTTSPGNVRDRERAIAVVIGIVAMSFVSYWISGISQQDAGHPPLAISVQQFTETMGLKSGQPYDILLGDRVDGSVGSSYFSGGMFGAKGSMKTQAGSSINVGFHSADGSYYILQLPLMTQTTRGKPTGTAFKLSNANRVTITLNKSDVKVSDIGRWEELTPWVRGECRPGIDTVLLVQRCVTTNSTSRLVVDDRAKMALPGVVMKHFEGAIVELTPEAYAQYVGTP